MSTKIIDGVYKIEVPMFGPLQCLNSYLILGKGNERNLIVDVGYDEPNAQETLRSQMAEFGADFTNTDIFLTHSHVDHAEAASSIKREHPDVKIYIGEKDGQYLRDFALGKETRWNWPLDQMLLMGFSEEFYRTFKERRDKREKERASRVMLIDYDYLHDGDILNYGGHELRCYSCPGHSPGLTCLYMADNSLMFLGDNILFDITPGISCWDEDEDPLDAYLKNVSRLKELEIDIPLPAHRGVYCTCHERIDEILVHHKVRLEEARLVLENNPGATAFEVASKLTWNVMDGDWSKFTPELRVSATGEAIAHLNYFVGKGIAKRKTADGVWHFYLA